MHLLSLQDLTKEDILALIDKAIVIKNHPEQFQEKLKGKSLALVFEKPSTRTRVSFEIAIAQLGGYAIYLDFMTTHLKKASLKDEIKCLSRYVDIIAARVFNHEDLVAMANHSEVPIINALSDRFHPCQILADLMTIKEKLNFNCKLAYVGDGNNVCNSLIIGCSKLGIKIGVATPPGYEPLKEVVELGVKSNVLVLTHDPKKVVKNADIVYTDTWVSMGKEIERETRIKLFRAYQITKELIGDALFMHCLPAYRGYEVTDEVIDSRQSVVFDQAENRLYTEKALLLRLLENVT